MTRSLAMAGCNNVIKTGYVHSFEGIYGWGAGAKGLMGYPVTLRTGMDYELSDASTLSAGGSWGEHYEVSMRGDHKINDHITVGCW